MTNGEYYSALSNVMQNLAPKAASDLSVIKKYTAIRGWVEIINALHDAGAMSDLDRRKQLMSIAEEGGLFSWSDEEKRHLLGSLADEK